MLGAIPNLQFFLRLLQSWTFVIEMENPNNNNMYRVQQQTSDSRIFKKKFCGIELLEFFCLEKIIQ
jgi:hypothetical protein